MNQSNNDQPKLYTRPETQERFIRGDALKRPIDSKILNSITSKVGMEKPYHLGLCLGKDENGVIQVMNFTGEGVGANAKIEKSSLKEFAGEVDVSKVEIA